MDIVDEAAVVIERVRSEGVRRVAAALATEGEAECIGCGEEIEPARRAAMPSATRCIVCQGRVEARDRTRATEGGML
jgi:phage/conjugal plasmid C-4 type zinc finger TraR family protein